MDRLSEILLQEDCAEDLWSSVESGEMDDIIPELSRLEMEQDPIHKHKDVLAHTIAVVNKTKPDIVVRLAALFHDIGKPDTRSFSHGGVNFRHHEEVGATASTRERLEKMGVPLLSQGVVAGMTGVLLGECRRRGLDTFAILAEANGPPGAGLPDARAAARIIEKLDSLLPNLSLPTEPLIEEAERIEEQIKEMLQVHLGKMAEDEENAGPSSMIYG